MGRPTFDHQDQGIIKSEVVGDGLELLLAGTCWSSITYWPSWKALRLFMLKVSGPGGREVRLRQHTKADLHPTSSAISTLDPLEDGRRC